MKAKTIVITLVIVLMGTLVNASSKKLDKTESVKTEYQKPKIAIDQNNMVVVTYLDTVKKVRRKRIVRIVDESGEVVNYFYINRKGSVRYSYDFSRVPDGDYSFMIYEKNKLTCSKEISKQTCIKPNIDGTNLAINEK